MKKLLDTILIFITVSFLSLQGKASLPEAYNEIDFYEDNQEELVVQIETEIEEPLFEEFQVAVEPISAGVLTGWFLQGLFVGAGSATGGLIVGKTVQAFTSQSNNPNNLKLYFEFLESKEKIIKYTSFEEMPPHVESVARDRLGPYFKYKWIRYAEEGLNGKPMLQASGNYLEIYKDTLSIDGRVYWIGRNSYNKRMHSTLAYKNGIRMCGRNPKKISTQNKIIKYRSFKNMPPTIKNVVKERFGTNFFKDHDSIAYIPAEDGIRAGIGTGHGKCGHYNTLIIGGWGHWDLPEFIEFYDNGAWAERDYKNRYTGVTSKNYKHDAIFKR